MQLQWQTEVWGVDDPSWINSRHGLNNGRSVTLKMSAFTASTHYPDKFLKSGIPLQALTGADDDFFGPLQTGGTLAGFVLAPQPVKDGNAPLVCAMLEHGRIKLSNLPVSISSTQQATNPRFIYVP